MEVDYLIKLTDAVLEFNDLLAEGVPEFRAYRQSASVHGVLVSDLREVIEEPTPMLHEILHERVRDVEKAFEQGLGIAQLAAAANDLNTVATACMMSGYSPPNYVAHLGEVASAGIVGAVLYCISDSLVLGENVLKSQIKRYWMTAEIYGMLSV